MSLSSDKKKNLTPDAENEKQTDEARSVEWGTVYAQGREHALGGVEKTRSASWTEKDEEAYLARVKEKASALAMELLDEAKQDAERIRKEAREEGYSQGLAQAQEELDSFRSNMADSVSAILATIEGQCASIFQQWREDLIAVTKLAVEKITGLELSVQSRPILEKLLTESVSLLEKRRELVLKVNPEDEPVINDIIGLTKEKFPDVSAWRVKADPSVSPGGMLIESESSIAESRIEGRRQAVEEVLAHLTLPGVP